MIKLKDIRGEDTPELTSMLLDLRKESFDISFRSSADGGSNPSRRNQIRRTIARIKTVLREREVEAKNTVATTTENA